jgi:hypothetical protein
MRSQVVQHESAGFVRGEAAPLGAAHRRCAISRVRRRVGLGHERAYIDWARWALARIAADSEGWDDRAGSGCNTRKHEHDDAPPTSGCESGVLTAL